MKSRFSNTNFDDGYMVYLDYSLLNDEGKPCVIVAGFNGEEYEVEETISEDFSEFVFYLVMEQLEGQLPIVNL